MKQEATKCTCVYKQACKFIDKSGLVHSKMCMKRMFNCVECSPKEVEALYLFLGVSLCSKHFLKSHVQEDKDSKYAAYPD